MGQALANLHPVPIQTRLHQRNKRLGRAMVGAVQTTARGIRDEKAAPRFELGVKDLQSSALPLGHAAGRGANSPNRIVSAMACPLACWS
jgi:hypothetical protein